MSSTQGRILFVDDDAAMRDLAAAALGAEGFAVTTSHDGDAALAALREDAFDAVVTDLNMRAMDGLALCREVIALKSDIPVLVLTAFGSMETAIAALRAGAWDFLTKPVDMEELARHLARAVENARLRREVARLRRREADAAAFTGIIGKSAAMARVLDLLERVAGTDVSVLITGESGTGKEVVARAIHAASDRRDGPFIAVNCAAVPEQLLESELFGHVRGAFTGAHRARTGLFVQADGGTLLLDEIGEMPATMQTKLLRALQERRVRPVGQEREVTFDTRILASTHRDLSAGIAAGEFREDLFYRLHVVNVALPPLRERGQDVLLLAQAFLRELAARHRVDVRGLSPAAADHLLAYAWPGNVRELRNCVERAVALTRYDIIQVADLPPALRELDVPEQREEAFAGPEVASILEPMHVVERRHILRVLEAVEGNRTRAAEVLELDRKTLYRKLKRYEEEDAGEDV